MYSCKIALLICVLSIISCGKKKGTEVLPPKEEVKVTPQPVQETAIAFPGAEGFGKIATGGR